MPSININWIAFTSPNQSYPRRRVRRIHWASPEAIVISPSLPTVRAILCHLLSIQTNQSNGSQNSSTHSLSPRSSDMDFEDGQLIVPLPDGIDILGFSGTVCTSQIQYAISD